MHFREVQLRYCDAIQLTASLSCLGLSEEFYSSILAEQEALRRDRTRNSSVLLNDFRAHMQQILNSNTTLAGVNPYVRAVIANNKQLKVYFSRYHLPALNNDDFSFSELQQQKEKA
jgi:hypothetical protein